MSSTLICSFDTETTGTGPDARLVEMGAVLLDDEGREHGSVSLIVQPDGFEISDEVARIHGISMSRAQATGVPAVIAVAALTNLWSLAATRIAFNIEFDDAIVATELRLLGKPSILRRPPGVCVKELSSPILNLPPTARMLAAGYNKPKPPNLREAYRHFFGEDPPGHHSALADARAAARVYLAIVALRRDAAP